MWDAVYTILNRLSKDEDEHKLEPRAMDVLSLLLAQPGQVVATDEQLTQVWSGSHGEPSMVAKRITRAEKLLGRPCDGTLDCTGGEHHATTSSN